MVTRTFGVFIDDDINIPLGVHVDDEKHIKRGSTPSRSKATKHRNK